MECMSLLYLLTFQRSLILSTMIYVSETKGYGFSTNALKLMHSYLKNRKQKVQTNNKFSLERDVIAGVPQGSIDASILCFLFNIVY